MAKKQPTALAVERVPVADLHADPANARKHPERNLSAIRASLTRFGQQRPLLIDGDNVVRAGNGTLEAARSLGWDALDCVRTRLKGSEATAYAIADNRTAEHAEWDDTALAETLRALQSEDFELEAVGFTAEEIDELCGSVADGIVGQAVDNPEGEWQGMPECENEDVAGACRSVIVHFKTLDDVRAFGELIGQPVPEKAKYLWHPRQAMSFPSRNPYVDEP